METMERVGGRRGEVKKNKEKGVLISLTKIEDEVKNE